MQVSGSQLALPLTPIYLQHGTGEKMDIVGENGATTINPETASLDVVSITGDCMKKEKK